MPLNVPGPEECEAEEDKWERVLRERREAGREVKGDALRGLMAYIRVGRFFSFNTSLTSHLRDDCH